MPSFDGQANVVYILTRTKNIASIQQHTKELNERGCRAEVMTPADFYSNRELLRSLTPHCSVLVDDVNAGENSDASIAATMVVNMRTRGRMIPLVVMVSDEDYDQLGRMIRRLPQGKLTRVHYHSDDMCAAYDFLAWPTSMLLMPSTLYC